MKKISIKAKPGFTLVELMTVLAVAAILFAIGTPLLMSWMPDIRLRSAARESGSLFQMARLKAASQSVTYRVVINGGLQPYSAQIQQKTAGGTWVCEKGNYTEYHKDVQLQTPFLEGAGNMVSTAEAVCRPDGTAPLAPNCYTVEFLPDGTTSASGEIQVRMTNAKNLKYRILVHHTTGRVKVENHW